MKFLKTGLFVILTLTLTTSFAAINCPSLDTIKNTPLLMAAPACEDGSEDCGDYIAAGMVMQDDQVMVLIAGLFDEVNTLGQGEALINQSHEPVLTNIEGQELCLYYGIEMGNDGRLKVVAAVPYDQMDNSMSLSAKKLRR